MKKTLLFLGITLYAFQFSNAQWNNSGNNTTTGSVGIQTTNLSIANTGLNDLVIGNGTGSRGLVVNAGPGVGDNAILAFAKESSMEARFMYNPASGRLQYSKRDNMTELEKILFSIKADGNVGIGEINPEAKLEVKGSGTIGGFWNPSNSY